MRVCSSSPELGGSTLITMRTRTRRGCNWTAIMCKIASVAERCPKPFPLRTWPTHGKSHHEIQPTGNIKPVYETYPKHNQVFTNPHSTRRNVRTEPTAGSCSRRHDLSELSPPRATRTPRPSPPFQPHQSSATPATSCSTPRRL